MKVYRTCVFIKILLQKVFKIAFNQFNTYLFSAKVAVFYKGIQMLVCSLSQFMIRSVQRTALMSV